MTGTYYNENDEKAAAWLRELIARKVIPDGEVDTRSIVDVHPDDLAGFRHCHFFAGIGGWAYALRLAGWPDDRDVWTGSCPCQPWSVAGKSAGADDPRHLWPAWFRLIEKRHPPTIFGEQVASQDGLYWLDLVYVSLEAVGYAVGALNLPAASAGAPHGRQRLWVVAESSRPAVDGQSGKLSPTKGPEGGRSGDGPGCSSAVGGVADDDRAGRDRLAPARLHERRQGPGSGASAAGDADGARRHDTDRRGSAGSLADARGDRAGQQPRELSGDDAPGAGRADGDRPVEDTTGRRREQCNEGQWVQESGVAGAARRRVGVTASGGRARQRSASTHGQPLQAGADSFLADAQHAERRAVGGPVADVGDGADAGRAEAYGESGARREVRGMADADGGHAGHGDLQRHDGQRLGADHQGSGATFWADCDWIPCLDGKARPVERGTFPLVAGLPGGLVPDGDPSESEAQATTEARVMRLRGYGNSIVPQLAAEVIAAYLEIKP